MKKIVFTGPECSGKSTLSKALAKKFNLPLVKEYAREYLNQIGQSYTYDDLVTIAKAQLKLETEHINLNLHQPAIICDTNLQVIKIWSQAKYGKCDSFILHNQDQNCLYILCKPDIKWIFDPLRENENNRDELFEKYHNDLINNNLNFLVSEGTYAQRIQYLSENINKLIS